MAVARQRWSWIPRRCSAGPGQRTQSTVTNARVNTTLQVVSTAAEPEPVADRHGPDPPVDAGHERRQGRCGCRHLVAGSGRRRRRSHRPSCRSSTRGIWLPVDLPTPTTSSINRRLKFKTRLPVSGSSDGRRRQPERLGCGADLSDRAPSTSVPPRSFAPAIGPSSIAARPSAAGSGEATRKPDGPERGS